MDEVREQQQIADEISQVISNPIGFGQEVDEDDLLKELEEMEQEELDKQLLDTTPEHLPEVPTEVPVATPRKTLTICFSFKLFNIFYNFRFKTKRNGRFRRIERVGRVG